MTPTEPTEQESGERIVEDDDRDAPPAPTDEPGDDHTADE